jgi:hypothetical protein
MPPRNAAFLEVLTASCHARGARGAAAACAVVALPGPPPAATPRAFVAAVVETLLARNQAGVVVVAALVLWASRAARRVSRGRPRKPARFTAVVTPRRAAVDG